MFALGGILGEILTGAPPYRERSSTVQIEKATCGEIQEAHERIRQSDADEMLVQLAIGCLDPDVDIRPADAGEVADMMGEYIKSSRERIRKAEIAEEKARTVALEQRKRFRNTVVAACIGFVLVLVGTVVYYQQQSRYADQVLEVERRERQEATRTGYWATMNAAFGAYEAGRHPEAYEILLKAPRHLRDWEWHYLRAKVDNSTWFHAIPREEVHAAVFLDEGSQVALVTEEGVVRIIDTASRSLVQGPTKPLGAPVAINPSGNHLLTRDQDQCQLWELATGTRVRSFPSYPSQVAADDNYAATGYSELTF